jgi:hypothetical protein
MDMAMDVEELVKGGPTQRALDAEFRRRAQIHSFGVACLNSASHSEFGVA